MASRHIFNTDIISGNILWIDSVQSTGNIIEANCNFNVKDDLNVGKNTHLSGTIHVDQDAVLKSNLYLEDDLNVGKNTYLSGTIHVDQDAVLKSNLYLEDDLNVGKNTYLSGTIHVDQDAVLKSNLYLEDDLNVGKNTHLSGTIHVDQDAVLKSNLYLEDDLNVGKNTHLSGTIHVDQDAVLKSGLFVEGDAKIDGNLYVSGDQVIMETATVRVEDKNIELAVLDSASDITADGGGLTLKGSTDKTILWSNSTDSWDFSENVGVADGKYIFSDKLRARDSAGLSLEDDSGNGIFIEDGGNVGIGTSDPNDKLHVAGGMLFNNYNVIKWKDSQGSKRNVLVLDSNDDFSIINNTTGDGGAVLFKTKAGAVESARIDSAGNVGIGAASPSAKLHVRGVFGAPATAGSADNSIARFGQVAGAGVMDVGFGDPYSWIQSRSSTDYSVNYDLALQPNGGNVGIGTTNPGAALEVNGEYGSQFRISRDSSPSTQYSEISAGGSTMRFLSVSSSPQNAAHSVFTFVSDDGTDQLERMRINSSGNVGIGTTSPSEKLEISNDNTNGVGDAAIAFTDQGGIRYTMGIKDGSQAFQISESSPLGQTPSDATKGTRFLIDTNGNVGIGTTSPGSALEVAGTAMISCPNSTLGDNRGLWFGKNGVVQGYIGGGNFAVNGLNDDDFGISAAEDGDLVFGTTTSSGGSDHERMRIDSLGRVGIGTASPIFGLDVADPSTMVLGGSDDNLGRTNGHNKSSRVGGIAYTNADLPVNMMMHTSTATDSILNFGWGTSAMNCPTKIVFGTAANVGTASNDAANKRMQIESNGDVNIAGRLGVGISPSEKLDLNGTMMLRNTTAPTTTTNRLYASGGNLFWNGNNVLDNVDTWRPISNSPTDGETTTSISSDWAFDNVKTAVPANAVFTDTVPTFSYNSTTKTLTITT